MVAKAGKPRAHLQLTAAAKDRTLQSAIKAHRVLSVHQALTGQRKDSSPRGLNAGSQSAMATLALEAMEPEAALAWEEALPDGTARAEAVESVRGEIRKRFPNGWQPVTTK